MDNSCLPLLLLTQVLKDTHLGMIRVWVTTTRSLALAWSTKWLDPAPDSFLMSAMSEVYHTCPQGSVLGDVSFHGGSWVSWAATMMSLFLKVIVAAVIVSPAPPILGIFLHSSLILITLFWEPVLGKWGWNTRDELLIWGAKQSYTPFHLSFIWPDYQFPTLTTSSSQEKVMNEASLWNSKHRTNSHLQTMSLEQTHAWL